MAGHRQLQAIGRTLVTTRSPGANFVAFQGVLRALRAQFLSALGAQRPHHNSRPPSRV
jgi:hypothetical protein